MDGTSAFPSGHAADERAEVSVLLVEDDAMVREWIESALRGSEFRVAGVASTAAEGVELAARRNPQVVLTDYRLPDRVGTELVRELRLRGVLAPAVVMTANEERGLNELARAHGAPARRDWPDERRDRAFPRSRVGDRQDARPAQLATRRRAEAASAAHELGLL